MARTKKKVTDKMSKKEALKHLLKVQAVFTKLCITLPLHVAEYYDGGLRDYKVVAVFPDSVGRSQNPSIPIVYTEAYVVGHDFCLEQKRRSLWLSISQDNFWFVSNKHPNRD